MELQLKRKLFRLKQQKMKIFVDNFMPPAFEDKGLFLSENIGIYGDSFQQ